MSTMSCPGGAPPRGGLKGYLVRQFGAPEGLAGRLAGMVMRHRASNRRRNEWTVDLMRLSPGHRVLELGYGPGYALELVCARLTGGGQAFGIDRSEVMRAAAARANSGALAEGRLRLFCGSVEWEALEREPALQGPFDRVYSVNVWPFWERPVQVFAALSGRLAPGGQVLTTVQPRFGAGSDATARQIAAQMQQAGLTGIRTETLPDIEPPAICVIGGSD